jgi:uncharacterized protein
MNPLIPFSIPVSGLRLGTYHYEFELDRDFFACFENSQIDECSIRVKLDFEKQTSMYVLDFQLEGTVQAVCDRCLEDFQLPIAQEQRLTIKFDEEERDEADVVYILPETKTLSVARFVYEFAHLALPLMRTHDAAGETCDPAMMNILENGVGSSDDAPPPPDGVNPWDVLKKLKTD